MDNVIQEQVALEKLPEHQELPLNTDFEIATHHDHTVAKGIYAKSKKVKSYRQVKDISERLVKWLNTNNGRFGLLARAYAISHCQVADEPFDMFVVAQEMVGTKKSVDGKNTYKNYFFPAQMIYNAKILEAPEKMEANIPRREMVKEGHKVVGSKIVVEKGTVSNIIEVPDACMSFPLRKQKNTKRYYRLKVQYQVKGWFGLRTKTEWVEGLKSHIFQHEIDHANGLNIYFKDK